jgi:hypothetical protein
MSSILILRMSSGYNGVKQSTQEVRYMKGGNDIVPPHLKGSVPFIDLEAARKLRTYYNYIRSKLHGKRSVL